MTLREIDLLARYIESFTYLAQIERVQDSLLCFSLRECADENIRQSLVESKLIDSTNLSHQSHDSAATSSTLASGMDSHTPKHSTPPSTYTIYLYLSMAKGSSHAFLAPYKLTAQKPYNAPFDIALSKLSRSQITASTLYNNDRILRLHLSQHKSYKHTHAILQCEFSGKHTNAIILNEQELVIEALHHISPAQSPRPVKVGLPLPPMPTNPNTKHALDSTFSNSSVLSLLTNALLQAYHIKQAKEQVAIKRSLLARYTTMKSRLQRLLDTLPSIKDLESTSITLNRHATLLLCTLHTLSPYQKTAIIDDETIALPEARTPQEAINQMFKESKKLAKKAKNIHKEAQNLTSKIAFLTHQIHFVETSDDYDTLAILSTQARKSSFSQSPTTKSTQKPTTTQKHSKSTKSAKQGLRDTAFVLYIHAHKISIGRNERENIQLLQNARADDIWLHIRDIPSSHMIIHCGKQQAPQAIVQKAGEILVGFSGVNKGDFCVDYTKRKFVKITSGAQVVYAKAKSLHYRT